ncbi:type IV pilus biogenesis protein PilM [Paenibacillus methanolicus]|uniref:Type IV pilus assembly protein PilM n=1 Tax=Paenibacillus methanolicus TaxID=582686 RepID=A0A5S5BVA4_9BACL|nr:pilus assembly protein PilM [Paenibacillus methanolicus]TYP70112.1 type IV pilus assembly protein PilM [Paenibacillus methanolicus]
MLSTGTKKIGFTINESGIRYAALRKKKKWEIDRMGFLPLPKGLIVEDQIVNAESIRISLMQWVKQERLTGASVTLAVPTSMIIVRKMRIPTTNAKELRHLIELEVETTLHLPFENPVYDYVRIGADEESTQVLIFAAPSLWIETCSDLLHDAGLRVKSAGIAASALAKSLFSQQQEPVSETMVVNIGDNVLDVYMFHEGNPIFMRAINLYETSGHEDGKLNDLQLSEVTAELSRMLNFYQFGLHEGASRITKTIIAGRAGSRAALAGALRETQPEIAVAEAVHGEFGQGTAHEFEFESYLVAAGLALPDEQLFHINLLPRVDREQKLFPVVVTSAFALWIVLLGLCIFMYVQNTSQIAENEEQIAAANDQLALLKNDFLASASTNSNPLATIEAIKAMQVDVVGMLKELESRLPAKSVIQTIGYSQEGTLLLDVNFYKVEEASRYLFDLRRMSFTQGVVMQGLTKQEASATVTGGGANVTITKPYSANYIVSIKKAEGGTDDGAAQ